MKNKSMGYMLEFKRWYIPIALNHRNPQRLRSLYFALALRLLRGGRGRAIVRGLGRRGGTAPAGRRNKPPTESTMTDTTIIAAWIAAPAGMTTEQIERRAGIRIAEWTGDEDAGEREAHIEQTDAMPDGEDRIIEIGGIRIRIEWP